MAVFDFLRRLRFLAILGMFCMSAGKAIAEQVPPAPEQPDWSAPAPEKQAPAGLANPDADLSSHSDSASELATDAPEPLPISQAEDLPPVNDVGVPTSRNFFLPDFDSYGQPFFERQGLRFRAGPVHLRIELSTSLEYNDNIFGSPTNIIADIVARVTPLIRIGMGEFQNHSEDYFALEYQPSYNYFLQNPNENYVSQTLKSSGQATFSRYSTNYDLNYVQNNAPTATQSGRQEYQILNFTWNNVYYLGAKTFASAALTVTNQNYENGQNYTTYSLAPQIGYAFSPKTTIFAGPYAGYADIGDGASQTFQGATLGFSYDTLRKVTVTGSAGVQARQFHGLTNGENQSFFTPIFNLAVEWKPKATTSLQISLVRDVQISDLGQGSTYTNTSFGIEWAQQIVRAISFHLSTGYQYIEYQPSAFQYPDGRNDSYFFASPTLSYVFWREQMGIDIYYQRQQRTSDIQFGGYTVDIYGIRFAYKF